MRKVLIIIIFIITIFAFFNNKDYNNIIQTAIVNSIGIDYDEESDEFTLYFFVLNNYNIGQSGNAATHTETFAYVSKATEKEILLAEDKIRKNSNIMFDLLHVRSLVIHQNFFKKDNARKLVSYFLGNSDYCQSFEMYITSSDIEQIFQINNFSEISAYFTILVNTQNNLPVRKVTFNDFCNDILDPNMTICYSTLIINEGVFYDDEKKFISLELNGCAFINKDYELCTFTYDDYPGLTYFTRLNDKSIEIKYNEQDETNDDYFFIIVNDIEIDNQIRNDKLRLKIHLNGNVIDNINDLETIDVIHYTEDYLKEQISHTHKTLIEHDIDYFNVNFYHRNKYDYKTLPLEFTFRVSLTS